MQAGGINLFGVVADSIDRERLNQTYQANRDAHRRSDCALVPPFPGPAGFCCLCFFATKLLYRFLENLLIK